MRMVYEAASTKLQTMRDFRLQLLLRSEQSRRSWPCTRPAQPTAMVKASLRKRTRTGEARNELTMVMKK